MEQVLLVLQVIIAAALIGIVLLQRSETDGFGLGSGSGANFMSGRGAANLLTRTTAILAALFILNSLALSVIAANHHAPSIVDTIEQGEATDVKPTMPDAEKGPAKTPAVEKDLVPTVPDADAAPKPAVKKAKKAKPAIDAEANMDTTGDESE